VELKRAIAACQDRLLELNASKHEQMKEVMPPPGSTLGDKFSWQEVSRTSSVRQPVSP